MSTQIRGNKQIKNITIENDQIVNGTVELNKLKEGSELLKRDGSVAATNNLNLDGHQLKNIGTPVDGSDAVRKSDLDQLASKVSGTLINREIVSGIKDGQNVTFTLTNEPTLATEQIFLNGLLLNAGANADYSIEGNVITFTVAPQATDAILANYIVDGIQLNVDVEATLAAFNGRLTTAESELFDVEQAIVELGNDANILTNRVTSTESDISALEVRATNIENNVDAVEASITAEQTRALSAEGVLDGRVTSSENEIVSLKSRMAAAEGDISTLEADDVQIKNSVSALEDGLQQETVNRINAVNSLNTRVVALENDDTAVDGRLDVLETDVAALETDLATEAATRLANDNALQSNINNEIADRTAAVSAVQTNLNTEISDRTAAIAAEAAARNAAISAEQSRAMAAEAALELAIDTRLDSIEGYDKETVYVDSVNGQDVVGRGSLLKPFKTINFAYSQIPVVTGATDLDKVTQFVGEKIVFDLAPGTYTENVQIGFKRARMAIVGNGARIIGTVKCKVLKADFPVASLESYKAQMPAPYTGASAQMCFEIAGEAGGGLEGDATASIVTVTGLTSLDFENGGANYNWDTNYGQFYCYFDNCNLVSGFNMIHDNSVATARAPACVVEIESSKVGNGDSATRSYLGFVPFGAATTVPAYGGLTLKAHNSTIASVLGPSITLGEIDGCRIYDIDRTMGAVVTNGSVSGSTSTSYVGIVNTQFRSFSGAAGSSVYKIGATGGNVSYKIDSVSHGTLTVGRTLDIAAGRTVTYTLIDRAAGVLVVASGNLSSTTVQAALEELQGDVNTINTSLSSKADSSALTQEIADRVAGDSSTLANAKTYADQKISALVNSAPAVLDTLKELSDALGGDQNFAATISGQIGAVDDRVDSVVADLGQEVLDRIADVNAEEARAMAAESSLNTRVAALESAPPPVSSLDSLSDVIVTNPSNGQVLQYNGVDWVNGSAPSTFSGSYNDLTDKPSLFSGSYADLSNKPNFAAVATSGSYNDLSNLPTLFSGDYADLANKPVLFSGSYNDLTDKPTIPSLTQVEADIADHETRISDLESGAFITREVPGGLVDGSNAVFTLANAPVAGSEQVFVNGMLQESGAGNDYTISGNTITFAEAPLSGWKIHVSYATGNYSVAPGGSSGGGSVASYEIAEFSHPEQNGSYASYTITHNLNTLNPIVSLQANFIAGDGFYPEGGWSDVFDLLYAGGFQGMGYTIVDANTVVLKIWRIAGGTRQIRGRIYAGAGSSSSSSITPFKWSENEQVYPFEVDTDNSVLYAKQVSMGTILPSGQELSLSLSSIYASLTADNIYRIEAYSRSNGQFRPIPFAFGVAQYSISLQVYDGAIKVEARDNQWNSLGSQVYVKIIYKK